MPPTRKGASVRLTGCDYIGPVSAATTASDYEIYVNANNATTFPRLSAEAAVWGKYVFNKVKFYVVGAAGSQTPGAMTSCPVYEASVAALTAAQVRNREDQVTSKFWEDHSMEFDCSKASRPWYVTDGADLLGVTGQDYIQGMYHLFTDAVASNPPTVDLWVCYDCEFCEAMASGDPDLQRFWQRYRNVGLPREVLLKWASEAEIYRRRMLESARQRKKQEGDFLVEAFAGADLITARLGGQCANVGGTEGTVLGATLPVLDRQDVFSSVRVVNQDNASRGPAEALSELPLRRDSAEDDKRRDLQCGIDRIRPHEYLGPAHCLRCANPGLCRVGESHQRDVSGKV